MAGTPFLLVDQSLDADGKVVRWEWDAGPHGGGVGPTLALRILQPGPLKVRLTVTDDAGLRDVHERTIQVLPAATGAVSG